MVISPQAPQLQFCGSPHQLLYPFRNPHYLNRCLLCHARQSSSGLCSDAGATTCSPFSVCEAGEEEARAPTASSDRMCTPCKPGRRCAVGWHGTMCLYRLHACECVHAVTGITSFVCMHAYMHACVGAIRFMIACVAWLNTWPTALVAPPTALVALPTALVAPLACNGAENHSLYAVIYRCDRHC